MKVNGHLRVVTVLVNSESFLFSQVCISFHKTLQWNGRIRALYDVDILVDFL